MDQDDQKNSSNALGGSPWDEPLDVPAEGPKIIGTIEASAEPEKDEKPVPFNIPENIDEQVGAKVPASNVASNTSAPAPASAASVDPAGKPISSQPVKEVLAPAPTISPKQEEKVMPAPVPTPSTMPPAPPAAAKAEKPDFVPPLASGPKKPEGKDGLLGIFARKKSEVNQIPPTPVANSTAQAPVQQPSTPASQAAKPAPSSLTAQAAAPKFAKSGKPSVFKKPVFLIISSAILLISGMIYLTEAGVISVGLENAYGAVGLESLWGGMPKSPEKALAKATANMVNEPNFKMSGTLSLTVNKTINSPITSPLVSLTALPYAFSDSQVGRAISGIMTQYEDYYSTDSDSTTSTLDTSSSSSSPTSSTSSSSSSSSSTSSGFLGDQSSYQSYQTTETTIKQLDFAFSGSSNSDSSLADVTMKKLVGADSKISLLNSKGELYVKTSSDIKFDPKADSNKWLLYNLSALSESKATNELFAATPDQNFSIIGSRVGNEKVGKTRCYNYAISELEIGDMFSSLGIKSEMVQKISGNIWIGVADHKIHRINLIIIPSISSSVTRAEIDIELSEFGVENSITLPSLSDKIEVNPAASTSASATDSTTPQVSSAAATTAEANDSIRKTDLASIKSALASYKQKYGRYPVSSSMTHLNTSGNIVETALVPTYLKSLPADPKAAEGWYYAYTSDGMTFRLSTRFENLNDREVTKSGDIYLHYVYND